MSKEIEQRIIKRAYNLVKSSSLRIKDNVEVKADLRGASELLYSLINSNVTEEEKSDNISLLWNKYINSSRNIDNRYSE